MLQSSFERSIPLWYQRYSKQDPLKLISLTIYQSCGIGTHIPWQYVVSSCSWATAYQQWPPSAQQQPTSLYLESSFNISLNPLSDTLTELHHLSSHRLLAEYHTILGSASTVNCLIMYVLVYNKCTYCGSQPSQHENIWSHFAELNDCAFTS